MTTHHMPPPSFVLLDNEDGSVTLWRYTPDDKGDAEVVVLSTQECRSLYWLLDITRVKRP